MAEIQPGLTLDLHEYGGRRLLVLRPPPGAMRMMKCGKSGWQMQSFGQLPILEPNLRQKVIRPGSFFETGERGRILVDRPGAR